MSEELGKIEKPAVEEFKSERKLFFIPLILTSQEAPPEFSVIYNRYWDQVDSQLSGLEVKLGPVKHIFHELVSEGGEEGIQNLEQMKANSLQLIKNRIEKGAVLEAIEDKKILAELTDWSRCLSLGLQSQKVFSKIYEFYNEAIKTRNEFVSTKINELLKDNESAILIMEEGHHIQFQQDVRVFYVAPPALDELKRWMRDYEAKQKEIPPEQTESPSDNINQK